MADGPVWSGEDVAGGGRRYDRQGPPSEAAGSRATTQRPPPPPPPGPQDPGIQSASTTDDRSGKRRAFDIGVLVAILALLFAGITYVMDLRGQDRADRRQARQDLSQTISDIEALPRDYLEQINNEDPNIAETAFSLFTGELVAAVAHAEDIREAHPEIFETVDVFVVGNAQLVLSNFDLAVDELVDAEDLAVRGGDTVVATAARRGLGTAYFGLGSLEDGRAAFQRASDMEGFDDIPEMVINSNEFVTLKQWVGAELAVGDCRAAAERFVELEAIASRVFLPVDDAVADSSIESLRTGLQACG